MRQRLDGAAQLLLNRWVAAHADIDAFHVYSPYSPEVSAALRLRLLTLLRRRFRITPSPSPLLLSSRIISRRSLSLAILVVGPTIRLGHQSARRRFHAATEVIAGAKARVVNNRSARLPLRDVAGVLISPDLADRHGEAFQGLRDALALLGDQRERLPASLDRRHAAILQAQRAGGKAGHNRAANRNAGVAVLFCLMRRSVLINASLISVWVCVGLYFRCIGAGREQWIEQLQVQSISEVSAACPEEQLEHFFEQACRRDFRSVGASSPDRRGRVFLDTELASPQSARPAACAPGLMVALRPGSPIRRIRLLPNVVYAVGVIEDALADRIVIEGVDGEVAALRVFFRVP